MTIGFHQSNPDPAFTRATPETVLARALAQARQSGLATTDWTPGSVEQAYDVQKMVLQDLGETVGAWKTAGLDENGVPLIAPIHAGDIVRDGRRAPPEEGWLVEVELGFHLKRDIPASHHLDAADILDAVSDVLVCFELCRTRLSDPNPPRLLFMADGLANDGLVIGDGLSFEPGMTLADREAVLTIDGQIVRRGKTPDNLAATAKLLWLARQQAPHGGLRAGQVVITGSLTAIAPLEAGQVAIATVAGIGSVTLHAND